MENITIKTGLFVGLAILGLAGNSVAQSSTEGWVPYADTFYVQRPYDVPVSARFSDTGGMYTTWVLGTDKPFEKGNPTDHRTEMRWDTWPNQTVEHMWSGDVMYEPGTLQTCVMQIKANTPSSEAVYLRVVDGGDLFYLGNGATVLKAGYGKWFNLKSALNAKTNMANVWINDVLVATHHTSSASDWYFKNGCYGEVGTIAKVHFKNIKTFVKGNSTGLTIGYPSPASQWKEDVSSGLARVYDLRGKSIMMRPRIFEGKNPRGTLLILKAD